MKGHKTNIFIRFRDYMTTKYKAPEECKLLMAERNLNTMVKAQVMLIIMMLMVYIHQLQVYMK